MAHYSLYLSEADIGPGVIQGIGMGLVLCP
jgi:hypothetical protein